MGTGAPLPPQVFVVVNGVKTLVVTVSVGALTVGQRFDKVHLVLETHKPPVVPNRNIRVETGKTSSNSQTDTRLQDVLLFVMLAGFHRY